MKTIAKLKKMQNWFFAFILLVFFSCSKENQNEFENSAILQEENFVGLSPDRCYDTNYDWSMMPITFSTVATANFISDVHKAIGSMYPGQPSYSCGATGVTANLDMGKVLKTKFNYKSADVASYNYLVVKSDVSLGRPVILSGFSSSGGHMWVCDGYKAIKYDFIDCTGFSTLHFSMRWGWEDNKNDGFFAYNNFGVGEVDGGGNTGYNKSITMIYNIKP